MRLSTIKKKAHELFDEASFLVHINNQAYYERTLEILDALMGDYDNNIPLIEILSTSIDRWEESAEEFYGFNKRINSLQVDHVVLKTLMEQYDLGVADFPEIGSKSLISKIINNKRSLTKEHITALSQRFKISPALFF